MFGKIKSLRELFEIELRYAYDCENKLVQTGLPSMIEAASSSELKGALQQHLAETRTHVARLERVFGAINAEPKSTGNAILDDMTAAVKDSVSHIEDSSLRDSALIVNGNFVEHYEIAMYGSLVTFAQQLGIHQAATILEETLKEEQAADAKLTEIAKSLTQTAARSVSV
jgi:ferritin-like metal-binding protein YciE